MCNLVSCFGFILDFFQRIVTYILMCCIGCIICIGVLFGLVFGVAYGYNYSMAEYVSLRSKSVRTFMESDFLSSKNESGRRDIEWRDWPTAEPDNFSRLTDAPVLLYSDGNVQMKAKDDKVSTKKILTEKYMSKVTNFKLWSFNSHPSPSKSPRTSSLAFLKSAYRPTMAKNEENMNSVLPSFFQFGKDYLPSTDISYVQEAARATRTSNTNTRDVVLTRTLLPILWQTKADNIPIRRNEDYDYK